MSGPQIGDRVSWFGWFNFGTERRRVNGHVVKVGLAVPIHRQEGEPGTPSWKLVVTRYEPVVQVVMDGHEPKVHESPCLVEVGELMPPLDDWRPYEPCKEES